MAADLGGCPRIESLLRKSGFWPIFPIKFVKYSKYSPHLIEKMHSKPLSLATPSILGQPPGRQSTTPGRQSTSRTVRIDRRKFCIEMHTLASEQLHFQKENNVSWFSQPYFTD